MVMGHTHDCKMVWSGREKDPVYVNSGFYCASVPDMESGRKFLTFAEVAGTGNVGFVVSEKRFLITGQEGGSGTVGPNNDTIRAEHSVVQ